MPPKRERATSAVLPLQSRRRSGAVSEPVQHDVVQHVVFHWRRSRIGAVGPLRETWMHQGPRCESDRRVRDAVTDRLPRAVVIAK
jgi:hypothetical protein